MRRRALARDVLRIGSRFVFGHSTRIRTEFRPKRFSDGPSGIRTRETMYSALTVECVRAPTKELPEMFRVATNFTTMPIEQCESRGLALLSASVGFEPTGSCDHGSDGLQLSVGMVWQ